MGSLNYWELTELFKGLLRKKGMKQALAARGASVYCQKFLDDFPNAGGVHYYQEFKEQADKILRRNTSNMTLTEMDKWAEIVANG